MASASSHTQESLLQVDETVPTRSFGRLVAGLSTAFAVCALAGIAVVSHESRTQQLRGVKVDSLTGLSEQITGPYATLESNYDENSAPYREGVVTGLGPSGVWNHDSLKDLEKTHKYGKQANSPTGLGGSVALQASQDMTFLEWVVQPGDLVEFDDTVMLGKANDKVVELKAGSSGSIMRTEGFSVGDVIKSGQKVLIIGHPIPQPLPVTSLLTFIGFFIITSAGIYASKKGTRSEKQVDAQAGYRQVAHEEQVQAPAVHMSSPQQAAPAFTATRHVQQTPLQVLRPGPGVPMPAAVVLSKRSQPAASPVQASSEAEASEKKEQKDERSERPGGDRPGLPRVSRLARATDSQPEAPAE